MLDQGKVRRKGVHFFLGLSCIVVGWFPPVGDRAHGLHMGRSPGAGKVLASAPLLLSSSPHSALCTVCRQMNGFSHQASSFFFAAILQSWKFSAWAQSLGGRPLPAAGDFSILPSTWLVF